MSIDLGCLIVSEATPSGSITSDPSMADWLWFKPSTGVWNVYNTSTGQWAAVDVAEHGHPAAAVTGEFEGAFRKITIVNGIITDFELEE